MEKPELVSRALELQDKVLKVTRLKGVIDVVGVKEKHMRVRA